MSDVFDDIHKLKRNGESLIVIGLLLNKKTGRIRRPYTSYLNNSWYIIGDIYCNLGRFEEAIKAFKNAFKYWSSDVDSLLAISNCYLEVGKIKMARFYIEKALVIDNENGILRYNFGNILFDMGEYEGAIKQYGLVDMKDVDAFKMAQLNLVKSEEIAKEKVANKKSLSRSRARQPICPAKR